MSASPNSTPCQEHLDALRDAARRLLTQEWPPEQAVAWAQTDSKLGSAWQQVARQGWLAIGDDAELGGLDELMLLIEELGRAACPLPLVESYTLHKIAKKQHDCTELHRVASALTTGQAAVAVAIATSDGQNAALTWQTELGKTHLSGQIDFVEGIQLATDFLVIDEDAARAALVSATAAGLTHVATPGYAVPVLHRLHFESVPATVVPYDSSVGLLMRLGLLMRALGAARRTFELAVEWAKTRVQFGQPIGRFQAIQHKLADAATLLDASTLLIERAVAAVKRGDMDAEIQIACAQAYAGPAMRRVTLEAHHVFAGVGYFEEHEAPRHLRRVHADMVALGGLDRACNLLAEAALERGGLPDIHLSPEADTFRAEVRAWARTLNIQPQLNHGSGADQLATQAISKGLIERGWIGLGWPKTSGGQERSVAEQFVFAEEIAYHGISLGLLRATETIIGPALLKFGTPAQVQHFIPRILKHEVSFCLGYSEPESGSDLASLRTRAIPEGDGWIINGSKLFTTMAEDASHIWLAVRTDPEQPGHRGISVFIVPKDSPGISVRPMRAMHGGTACAVFYDDVHVDADALVGKLHGGWQIITAALAHERILMGAAVASVQAQFDQLLVAIKARQRRGQPMAEDSLVRHRIGSLAAQIEAARMLAVRNVQLVSLGKVPIAEASMSKCVTGELMERIAECAMDLFGTGALLSHGSPGSIGDGLFERALRLAIMYVVGGGTNEIQRNIIATVGLGLPR
ncbi:acyl-CoA dehydrogenase [Noviherbaspirillum sedimenti]|uniref:Acyl-CoA dehydrogenase n=1 Tax=Noviherbaspirillum sedimenti TaxID=2320865 RepID=A0A3A3FY60_9BURK|nr:acyl-CoA dehydrogenase [Noviherbaspirillum sedimenti]RJG00664.1 acyl-CoA dehydrogenase [Noviherbaspirillum sedimenti]